MGICLCRVCSLIASRLLFSDSSCPETRWQFDDGIDVYVDSARFLPDSCTVSRVFARAYRADWTLVGYTDAYAQLDGDVYCPKYQV